MIDYTIYSIGSGEILRNISISSITPIEEQLAIGEGSIPGFYAPIGYKIIAGKVKARPPIIPTVEEVKERTLTELNYATSSKILKEVPIWQQLNLMLRMVELVHIGESAWTKEETVEFKDIQTKLDKIKTIRDLSNTFAERITTATTPEQIKNHGKIYNAGLEKL